MSSLSELNKAKMEDVFQMHGGYVGNYSNHSFRNLIIKATGIDGLSDSGKDSARVDLLLDKDNKEVAILEALRLNSVNASDIKEHVDKAITNYNALGTPTFLLIYVGSPNFGDFWNRFLMYMKGYTFSLERKKAVEEQVHPNASARVCNCILSRDGFDFPVTFLAVNVYKKIER